MSYTIPGVVQGSQLDWAVSGILGEGLERKEGSGGRWVRTAPPLRVSLPVHFPSCPLHLSYLPEMFQISPLARFTFPWSGKKCF